MLKRKLNNLLHYRDEIRGNIIMQSSRDNGLYGSKHDKLQACFLININLLIMYCNFCNGVFINISGETNFIDERKANDVVAKTIIEKRGTQSY